MNEIIDDLGLRMQVKEEPEEKVEKVEKPVILRF